MQFLQFKKKIAQNFVVQKFKLKMLEVKKSSPTMCWKT